MIYIPYAHCEVDCDDGRKAMSQATACLLHKKNDVLNPFPRIQNMADVTSDLFSKNISRRFWQIVEQGQACIFLPPLFLFRFVCSVFCFLGTVFLFFFFLFQKVFFYIQTAIFVCKFCTCSNVHHSFACVYQKAQAVLSRDTICNFWSTWLLLSLGRRSITC